MGEPTAGYDRLRRPASGLLVVLYLAYGLTVAFSLPRTLHTLSSWWGEVARYDTEALRTRHQPWYRRHYECFEKVRREVGENESILLEVEDVPEWFAPYYLAPRHFLESSRDVVERLDREGRRYFSLRLKWEKGRLSCHLQRAGPVPRD